MYGKPQSIDSKQKKSTRMKERYYLENLLQKLPIGTRDGKQSSTERNTDRVGRHYIIATINKLNMSNLGCLIHIMAKNASILLTL